MNYIKTIFRDNWVVLLLYVAVAMLLLGPLLGPGYILTLDMVFTPNLALPDTVTSSYLFRAFLHILNLILPGDVIQKLVLFAILVLSGIGMHRLTRSTLHSGKPVANIAWGAYAAGLIYMVNPFMYSRFMAGQYSVLLGYSLLPFFILAIIRFLNRPSLKQSLPVLITTLLISIVSIHTLGLAVIVGLTVLVQTVIRERSNRSRLIKIGKFGALSAGLFVIASSYWLIPTILGTSATATSIETFKTTDQSAFETGGGSVGGKIMQVLRLQGFWGERNDLFLLPQDTLKIWGLVAIFVWALVILGGITSWKNQRESSLLYILTASIAALLAAGVGTLWLSDKVPFFAGYREPQKFVALIAVAYAVLIGLAVPKLMSGRKTRIGRITLAIALVLILVGFTPVMFRGFNGQLTPRQYPADWTTLNQQLNSDTDNFQVLFLPWHLYTRYEFAGRVIASPAEGFFDKPMIVSDDPELGTVMPAIVNANKQLLTQTILPNAQNQTTLGRQLVPLHVKYIILTKDADYQTYNYLDTQTDIRLLSDSLSYKLYLNTAYEKGTK